jgi:hypothetical protein
MAKSLIQIVQAVTGELLLNSPNAVLTSTDQNVQQLKALVIAACDELADGYDWNQLLKEHTITTTAGVSLYNVPSDYLRFPSNSQWNQSLNEPIFGNTSTSVWRALKSGIGIVGPHSMFRMIGGQVEVMPTPQSVQTYKFDYFSNAYVIDGASGVRKQEFTLDSDKTVFHDRLIINLTKLKFLQTKGFDTRAAATDFNLTMSAVVGADVPSPAIVMGSALNRGLLSSANMPDSIQGA